MGHLCSKIEYNFQFLERHAPIAAPIGIKFDEGESTPLVQRVVVWGKMPKNRALSNLYTDSALKETCRLKKMLETGHLYSGLS